MTREPSPEILVTALETLLLEFLALEPTLCSQFWFLNLKYENTTFHTLAGVIKKLLAEKQRPQRPFHGLYETTPEVKLF